MKLRGDQALELCRETASDYFPAAPEISFWLLLLLWSRYMQLGGGLEAGERSL